MSARILVVDDQEPNVRLLEARLKAEYFEVVTATNGSDALVAAKSQQPDIVLLDIMMPGMDGFEVCRRLKADTATRHIPVVMVTALDQREDRVSGLECGADDFLTKPVDDLTLFARVRSLLRLKVVLDELRTRDSATPDAGDLVDADPKAKPWALIVAGDERAGAHLQSKLPACTQSKVVTDPALAARVAVSGVDILLIDLTSPKFDGLRLCARVRSEAATRHVPIIAVVSPDEVERSVRALDLGVSDIIHRPVDAQELNARIRTQLRRKTYADRLRARLDESLEMAITDPLTGLHNRRYIASRLNQAVDAAANGGATVSVLIADLDHFKRINDTFGHEGGDAILKQFSDRLRGGLRALDLAARYGGEEFVIVMPETGLEEARAGAERLRAATANNPFSLPRGEAAKEVTVSIGVAEFAQGDSPDTLLRRADKALYRAKAEGRNRVIAGDAQTKAA
ncbi:PleD family two-component system response regulator [Hyphobacterium marinum]|uniref:diguanylate cyclase n=1 Tax=Hyphobacterium marinum TaxID=3116574 RepID=A0ABU7LZ39_9PROT|nr:PleD family two-component system response regulator [Hyphobacterium sp. Y6023]MEE2566826.1 PleD family two-component system response regulator [Hyphobacterium sp. Y6023]